MCHIRAFFLDTVEPENDNASSEPKPPKETIDFKELKRVDHILASLQRKVDYILALLVGSDHIFVDINILNSYELLSDTKRQR